MWLGIIFYPNEEGDVTDIHADIIGPGKSLYTTSRERLFRIWPLKLTLWRCLSRNTRKLYPLTQSFCSIVQTPYHEGIFRCKLVLGDGFPMNPPKGYFLSKIFHPNVATSGDICVNTLKRDWEPAKWSLRHIFEVIKCLLIVPFPESSLNEEAGRQFMEDYESYF